MACPHERETRLCGKFRVMNLSRHYVYVCSGVINENIFFIIYYVTQEMEEEDSRIRIEEGIQMTSGETIEIYPDVSLIKDIINYSEKQISILFNTKEGVIRLPKEGFICLPIDKNDATFIDDKRIRLL